MKKVLPALIALLLVLGCGNKTKGISYDVAKENPLIVTEIKLEIKDVRKSAEILSPKVKKMKIWSGVGSFVKLIARKKTPDEITGQEIQNDFREAFTTRFTNLGVKVVEQNPAKGITLTINIEQITLDLKKSDFHATVMYTATASKGGKDFHEQQITGLASKYNWGQKSGQKALSEAFSLAVNRLETTFLR